MEDVNSPGSASASVGEGLAGFERQECVYDVMKQDHQHRLQPKTCCNRT